MVKESKPVMRLMGEFRPGSEDWSLAEYRALFRKLKDIAGEGQITRYMRFSGETGGQTVLRFFGVETQIKDIPDGMTVLEPGDNVLSVLRQNKGTVTIWQYVLNWGWLDTSVPGRAVGEFKARMPPGWTSRSRQSIEFILTANAYFEKGKTADDDVRLVEYDSRWPEMYEKMADHLRKIIPREILLRTEHFGSTAIPGMPAKPVIDILLDIPSFKDARRVLIPAFNKPECEYWMQDGAMEFIIRKEFMGARTDHIHAAPSNGFYWERLAFRDYLRTHQEDARRYAALKHELAGRYAADREEYTNAKGGFVKEITDKALR